MYQKTSEPTMEFLIKVQASVDAAVDRGAVSGARYRVVAINDRTGKREALTDDSLTHEQACTVLRKMCPHPYVRKLLEQVTP